MSYTNRWFLKQAAALFGAALLLFGLSTSALVGAILANQVWLPKSIDQGWATLVGAVVGLSIVSVQASVGFRNLRRSQAHQAGLARASQLEQAQLDREARRDQFELQSKHDDQLKLLEKKALAAALNGELLAVHSYLSDRTRSVQTQKVLYEAMPTEVLIPGAQIEIKGAPTPIFDASISKMGLLEPSLISDIIELFQKSKVDISTPADKIPAGMIAKMLGAIVDGWDATHPDFLHLLKRFISVQYGSVDPGARILAKQPEANYE